jgi:hypothetical protein
VAAGTKTSPDPEPQNPIPHSIETLDGLYIAGMVNGRQRRSFDKKGGGVRHMTRLSIPTSGGLFKPERWCDTRSPSDVPRVGVHACLPITLQYYTSRAGTAADGRGGTRSVQPMGRPSLRSAASVKAANPTPCTLEPHRRRFDPQQPSTKAPRAHKADTPGSGVGADEKENASK